MKSYAPGTVLRTARLKTTNRNPHQQKRLFVSELDIPDEYLISDIEENSDPKLGIGIWVPVYMFLSINELDNAEDTTL